MMTNTMTSRAASRVLARLLLAAALALGTTQATRAQQPTATPQTQTPQTAQTPEEERETAAEAAGETAAQEPSFKEYKGVKIGSPMKEARERLGKPASRSDAQDFFVVSDDEIAQVFYDKEGRVNAVAVTYTGKADKMPTAKDVLGAEVAAGADGRIYKLVRYPSTGFWVAYARTAGDAPVTSVTMKKMRAAAR